MRAATGQVLIEPYVSICMADVTMYGVHFVSRAFIINTIVSELCCSVILGT